MKGELVTRNSIEHTCIFVEASTNAIMFIKNTDIDQRSRQ